MDRRQAPLSDDDLSTVCGAREFLKACETRLADRFGDIILVGELNTSIEDLNRLGSALRTIIDKRGQLEATKEFARSYPLALTEFLVASGVHGYRKGDYWTAILDRLGLPRQNYPARLGEVFESTVNQ